MQNHLQTGVITGVILLVYQMPLIQFCKLLLSLVPYEWTQYHTVLFCLLYWAGWRHSHRPQSPCPRGLLVLAPVLQLDQSSAGHPCSSSPAAERLKGHSSKGSRWLPEYCQEGGRQTLIPLLPLITSLCQRSLEENKEIDNEDFQGNKQAH